MAVEGIDRHDGAVERQHLQQLGDGGDLVGLGIGGNLREHEALIAAPGADHVQRRGGARRVERSAQNLAVNRNDAAATRRKLGHEPLEAGTELLRIEQAKHPAEGVVTGHTVLQLEKTAQKFFLGAGELGHVHRVLAAAQNRAQRHHHNLQQIMAPGIARPRIVKPLKAGGKPFHLVLHPRRPTNQG